MKQHITVDQLNEYIKDCWTVQQLEKNFDLTNFDTLLSENVELWKVENCYINWDAWNHLRYIWESDAAKSINIGKMIEILQCKYNNCDMQIDLVVRSEWAGTNDWHVVTGEDNSYIKEELCDALWEAVKYVLEKELEEEE